MTDKPEIQLGGKADWNPPADPFPRQPGPVVVTFNALDQRDVDIYIARVERYIGTYGFDHVTRSGNTLTIHPRAVND